MKTYREYYENVMRRVPGIHSVRVVNVDQDMSDCLKSISSDELPVLFVVVPSAQETGTDPDNVEEPTTIRHSAFIVSPGAPAHPDSTA